MQLTCATAGRAVAAGTVAADAAGGGRGAGGGAGAAGAGTAGASVAVPATAAPAAAAARASRPRAATTTTAGAGAAVGRVLAGMSFSAFRFLARCQAVSWRVSTLPIYRTLTQRRNPCLARGISPVLAARALRPGPSGPL